jgi:PKD repeat protein
VGAQHQVFPVESTFYGVTVTDDNGCSVVGTGVDVTVYPAPDASFTALASSPCVIPTEFVTVNTSQGATSYEWYQDTTIITDLAPVLTYDAVGTYTIALVATSAQGCTDSTTASVTVHPLPVANFVVSNPDGCLPVSTVLTSTSSNAVTFNWNFGDGTVGSGGSVGHSFFIAGSYAVTLTVTSAQGCTDQITIDSAVVVHPYPVADFTIIDLGSVLGSDYEFQNNSTGGVAFSWQFGDGGSSDLFSPIYSFDSFGGYDITLYVTNEFGCVDTARQSVTVDLLRGLFVPNAMAVGNAGGAGVFRPTGDGHRAVQGHGL